MYFNDTEVWRTSTAEPTTAPGIRWTYLKDMTEYLSLWNAPQKIIFGESFPSPVSSPPPSPPGGGSLFLSSNCQHTLLESQESTRAIPGMFPERSIHSHETPKYFRHPLAI